MVISPNCSVLVILQPSSLRRAGPFLSCSTLITDEQKPCAITFIIACCNLAAPPTLEQWNVVTSPKPLKPSVAGGECGKPYLQDQGLGQGWNSALLFHPAVLKMRAQNLLDQCLTSAWEGHQWVPLNEGCAFRGKNYSWEPWHFLLSGLFSGLISRLCVPFPMGSDMQPFMNLPPIL